MNRRSKSVPREHNHPVTRANPGSVLIFDSQCRDCACLDALGYYEKNLEAEQNGMFDNFWSDENESGHRNDGGFRVGLEQRRKNEGNVWMTGFESWKRRADPKGKAFL